METPYTSKLSASHREVLKKQVITNKSPGTILADFENLLNFIKPEGIQVTGGLNLLPMKSLGIINAGMINPIDIDLQRPQQKSYPYIHGLYLLLRLSGISVLKQGEKKQRLILYDEVYDSWQCLNPTEKYFMLFETWLLSVEHSVIGEHSFFGDAFVKWFNFVSRIGKKGLKIKGNKDEINVLVYIPGYYTMALLDLFGLISIKHAKPERGKGWNIEKVYRTAFGDAMLALFSDLQQDMTFFEILASQKHKELGALQHVIKPFFPQWRNNLTFPKQEFKEGTFVIKVSLKSAWRRIEIPATMFFDDLAFEILKAFDFDTDHLYEFIFTNRFGQKMTIIHPYCDCDSYYSDETRIGDIISEPQINMVFRYDFGTCWEFNLTIESIEPMAQNLKSPKLIESHGKAPEQYGF